MVFRIVLGIEINKTKLEMDKPFYLGQSILEIIKRYVLGQSKSMVHGYIEPYSKYKSWRCL